MPTPQPAGIAAIAIAIVEGLGPVASYFIDADKGADPLPVGGLTVATFRNAHLSYALTWFALALGRAGLAPLRPDLIPPRAATG